MEHITYSASSTSKDRKQSEIQERDESRMLDKIYLNGDVTTVSYIQHVACMMLRKIFQFNLLALL